MNWIIELVKIIVPVLLGLWIGLHYDRIRRRNSHIDDFIKSVESEIIELQHRPDNIDTAAADWHLSSCRRLSAHASYFMTYDIKRWQLLKNSYTRYSQYKTHKRDEMIDLLHAIIHQLRQF